MGHYSALDEISDRINKDLKKMGFKFLGSTIVYAFMQATSMVNDHIKDCYLYNLHNLHNLHNK